MTSPQYLSLRGGDGAFSLKINKISQKQEFEHKTIMVVAMPQCILVIIIILSHKFKNVVDKWFNY